jgi:hypothetical protein
MIALPSGGMKTTRILITELHRSAAPSAIAKIGATPSTLVAVAAGVFSGYLQSMAFE